MDKLIKHRFWILLALVPPLVMFGYYKANGAIQAATEERVKQLDAALGAIPKGDGPNDTFVKAEHGGLEVFNAELRKAVDAEFVQVWEDQKPRLIWPVEMEPFLPKDESGEVKYRGEFPKETHFTYKAEYQDQLDALWESIEPLKPIKPGTNSGFTGKVRLDKQVIPRHQFGDMLVPSEAIWDAQEDIWLLQLLFDAVRNVNRPAENAARSTVRWIQYVELMGGDGQPTLRGSLGGSSAGDESFMSAMAADDAAGPGRAMAAMGMSTANLGTVSFAPSEEFGNGFEAAAGGSPSDAGDEAFSGVPGMPGGPMMGPMMAGGFGGFGGKPIRYISFDESAKFQERGFYMSVLIDQRKIADFLVELSNSDWPIRIVRFNVGPNTGGSGVRRSSSTPMMAGGMPFGTGADEAMGGGLAAAMGGYSGLAGGTPLMGGSMAEDDAMSAPGFSGGPAFGMTAADEAGMGMPGMGMPGMGGGMGPSPLTNRDQIGELFSQPDLVQMDLCGVITMYRPPAPELLLAVKGTTEDGTTTAAEPAVEGADAQPAAADGAAVDPAAVQPSDASAKDAATIDPAAADTSAAGADSAFPETPAESPAEEPAAAPTDGAVPEEAAETAPTDAPVESAPPEGAPPAGS